ncbi:GNAT family N-acetyltransferase [Pseudaestuariivita sp.]|uniref:GNAT family N-acetyltransferase n=1 Tax=Pseudaestuariivita sp. TaxID=2211669 RepID=UPI004059DFE4
MSVDAQALRTRPSVAQPEAAQVQAVWAQTDAERDAAYALRYEVFVAEFGGTGPLVDQAARRERDQFDSFCDHLLLCDLARGTPGAPAIVGATRVMRAEQAARAGGFYTEGEFDITPLCASGRRLLELGRTCLHPDYRGGSAMRVLWGALAGYVAEHQIEILFGTASFAGTDLARLAPSLTLLGARYLAPASLRVTACGSGRRPLELMPLEDIDRLAAMRDVPALIKAYLKLGGVVGEGAFVDHAFNTTDVCLVLDTARMNTAQSRIYTGAPG